MRIVLPRVDYDETLLVAMHLGLHGDAPEGRGIRERDFGGAARGAGRRLSGNEQFQNSVFDRPVGRVRDGPVVVEGVDGVRGLQDCGSGENQK